MAERGRPRGFDRNVALRDAMLAFWNKGFEETTMSDLVHATGIRSGSLYAAFGSKEAFFREAVTFYRETVGPRVWSSLESESTIEAAIGAFLKRTAEAFSSPGFPRGCLIAVGAHHTGAEGNGAGDELRLRRIEDIARLKQRFERAVREDELPAAFDSAAAAAFYAALQAGMSILARDGASSVILHAIATSGMQSLAEMKRQSSVATIR